MARPRSPHVLEVKAALAARLQSDFAHPGGRFLSSRAVAHRFGVSYQTAHRLLGELQAEGLLRRQAASGSYVPGGRAALEGAQLVFHPRAKRKGSFGAHLREMLVTALEAEGVPVVQHWLLPGEPARLRRTFYPVVWECPQAVRAAAAERRFVLSLNDRPPAGLGGTYVDAVTTDDYSGGACAAELLRERIGALRGFAVLGGPDGDARSVQRIAGFRAHAETDAVICAESWFVEAGLACVPALMERKPAGIFACNDRLAEAVIAWCAEQRVARPPLIGFDNAPVAERLRLTTIGIPWSTMVEQAVHVIAERIAGGTGSARLVSLAHEPVVRLTA
jgi:DNA-binding transcriptional regulator YhcF (GntR family)